MAPRETPYPAVERLLTGSEIRTHTRCWRPRGTPTVLITHTQSGRATVRLEDRADLHVVSPGETVLWLPGAAQDFGPVSETEPWRFVWAHFHPRDRWHELLSWPLLGRGVCWIPAPAARLQTRIHDAVIEMDAYARSALPRATEFALNALERALLWLDSANPRPATIGEPVQEAVLFISRHLDQQLTVRDIAMAARLSPSRLAHVFKQQLGISPGRFVEQRRMERAQVLLESSSLTVGSISDAIGFSSQFYFAARFKAHTGMSPSDWRRRELVGAV